MRPDWKSPSKDDRTVIVAPMIAEGLTATQIAVSFTGASRSAIIGHCARNQMKLGGSVTDRERLERATQTTKARHADKPRKKYQRVDVHKIENLKLRADLVVAQVSDQPPVSRAVDRVGVQLIDLTDDTCRWPMGDPLKRGFSFCGHQPVDGKRYCTSHAARSVEGARR